MGAGPYIVSAILLLAGFFHYLPGVDYSRSPDHYRAWAFPAFRYSDIIWLYLRDGLAGRPIPYLQYPLEYPPLTGLLSWIASYAPGLSGYYLASWSINAACILLAIWSLRRIPGANPWPLAAAPALFFYPGHQFDPAAVGVTAAALAALALGRQRLGAIGLAAGVSLKLFPLAFLAALCADHVRHRRWRALAETVTLALAVTLAVNLPLAAMNGENWSFFFRWNRDRLADSGVWVLWRDLPTPALTMASLLTVAAGATVMALWALRIGGPLTATLGSTALLWWLFANKTFTTHLILWVFLALALLRPPLWLWLAAVAVDIVGFQIGNYLNLYNVPLYQSPALIHSAVVNLYDPLQLARSAILLCCVGLGIVRIREGRAASPWPLTRPATPRRAPGVAGIADLFMPAAASQRRWLAPLAIGSSYLIAALAMTWPLVRHLSTMTAPGFDPLLQIWLSRWVQHALATNPTGLFDANIFHPFPTTLAYTDANVPGALIAWPIDVIARDPIVTNNILTIGTFVLAAWGVQAVAVRLTGNRAAAWLAGFAYAFAPWRMVHLWHLNWLESAWLPWALLAFLRIIERPTIQRGIVFGLAAAVVTLTSFYLSVQVVALATILLAAAIIGDKRVRTLATVRSLAVATAVTAILAGPVYLPYLKVRNEQGLQRTMAETQEYKAVPGSWLSLAPWDDPTPFQRALGVRAGVNRALTTVGQERHADGHQHAEIVTEDALYPGVWTVLATILGLACWKRRWLSFGLGAVSIGSAILTLGPTLGSGIAGRSLPYGWLFEHVPLFTSMRAPARFGGLALLAIAVLAALGLAAAWSSMRDRLPKPRSTLIGAAATATAIALLATDLAAFPTPVEPVNFGVDELAAYSWLAGQPAGAVMEFPAESIFADPAGSSVRRHVGLSMLGSTIHWQPLVNGNSGFIPQSYSDLLERFVGNLQRPDGSLALRISHVESATIPLLQQLGVRYLVIHRDRYRAEDWPAVEAALSDATRAIDPAISFGDLLLYRVTTPLAAPPRPELRLFAPSLLDDAAGWSPVLALSTSGELPTLAAYTRPTTVAAEWFDAEGRPIHRDGWTFPVPAVMDMQHLVCSPVACRASADEIETAALPRPIAGWRPRAPGHYAVKLSVSGDFPLSCTIDLDVVQPSSSDPHLDDLGPRWAACAYGSGSPVNDPGRPAYAISPPSVTLAGSQMAVSATLSTRERQEIRGWWLLAPSGVAEPWREAVWIAPAIQRIVSPRQEASFTWVQTLPRDAPNGVYGLTLWFHRHSETGWEHALGGSFGIGPIVIEDGQARWAGPLRMGSLPQLALPAGTRATIPLPIAGVNDQQTCDVTWRILGLDDAEVIRGGPARCGDISIGVPLTVAPGSYRLVVRVLGSRDGSSRLEDGLTAPFTVLEPERGGTPR